MSGLRKALNYCVVACVLAAVVMLVVITIRSTGTAQQIAPTIETTSSEPMDAKSVQLEERAKAFVIARHTRLHNDTPKAVRQRVASAHASDEYLEERNFSMSSGADEAFVASGDSLEVRIASEGAVITELDDQYADVAYVSVVYDVVRKDASGKVVSTLHTVSNTGWVYAQEGGWQVQAES